MTAQDIKFMKILKAQGASKEEALQALTSAKMGKATTAPPVASSSREDAMGKALSSLESQGITKGTPQYEKAVSSIEQSVNQQVPKFGGTTLKGPSQEELMKQQLQKKAGAVTEEYPKAIGQAFTGKIDEQYDEISKARKQLLAGEISNEDYDRIATAKTIGAFAGAPAAAVREAVSPVTDPLVDEVLAPYWKESAGPALGLIVDAMGSVTSPIQPLADKMAGDDNAIKQGIDDFELRYKSDPSFKSKIDTALEAGGIAVDLTDLFATAQIGSSLLKGAVRNGPAIGAKGVELGQKGLTGVGAGIEASKEAYNSALQSIKGGFQGYRTGKKAAKITKEVERIAQNVDTLIKTKAPLRRASDKFKKDFGFDVSTELSNPRYFEGINIEGTRINADDAIFRIQDDIDSLIDTTKKAIPFADEFGGVKSRAEIREVAVDAINRQSLDTGITNKLISEIDDVLSNYPEEMNASIIEDLRKRMRNTSRDAKGRLKQSNHYAAIEKSAISNLFEIMDNLPVENSFPNVRQKITNLIRTKDFIENRLQGTQGDKGVLTRLLTKTIGATAGAANFGVLGAIGGSELAGYVTDIAINRQLGNSVKKSLLRDLIGDQPEILKQAMKAVDDFENYVPKQLGAPTSEFRSTQTSGEPINLPSKSASTIDDLEIQRNSRNAIQSKPMINDAVNPIDETIPLPPEKGKLPFNQGEIPQTRLKGLAEHAKKNGGITVDFDGNLVDKGYAFSILDKADEVSLPLDENFDKMFIEHFKKMKAQYGDDPKANLGGWIENNQFIADVSSVNNNYKQALYDGILKKQDAIGDLARYAKGEDGTIYITKEVIDSLEPLPRGSFEGGKSSFDSWEEAVEYYTKQNFGGSSKYADEIGDVSKIEIVPTGTNKFIQEQKELVDNLSSKKKDLFLEKKAATAEVYEEFKDRVLEIGEDLGVEVSDPSFMRKSDGRAIQKMFPEDGSVKSVKDWNRGAFLNSDFENYTNLIGEIKDRFKVVAIKNRLKNPTDDNYRDLLLSIEMPNGTRAEVQIIPRAMAEAKNRMHPLYEQTRVIEEALEAGPISKDQHKKLMELRAKQRSEYDKAWSEDAKMFKQYENEIYSALFDI